MIVGSLFSGIGGLDHGLARAGFRHQFFCEQDPWRRTVLAHHWPGVPIYDDVREVASGHEGGRRQMDRDASRSDAERDGLALPVEPAVLDLLSGGFPCQDVSVAGQRRGLAGARSGLFHEFARVIDALRPGWVLVENVPGLFSSNGGRDFGTVIGTLADLGYGVAWRVLDSRFFGVPQRRRRVFIVGTVAVGDPRVAAERAGYVLAVGARCGRHPATRDEAREDHPGASTVSTLASSGKSGGWRIGADEAAGGQLVAATVRSHPRPGSNSDGNLVAGPLGGGNDGIGRRSEDDPNLVAYPLARRGRVGGSELEVGEANIYNALRAGDGGSSRLNQVLTPEAHVRRLTPTECERLQALPDGWTNPNGDAPDSRRYAALGDAVTSSVGEWIGRRILMAETASLEDAPTLCETVI